MGIQFSGKLRIVPNTNNGTPTPTPTPSASTKAPIKAVTITCIKGKMTKKVTAAKPKCPTGYKKK